MFFFIKSITIWWIFLTFSKIKSKIEKFLNEGHIISKLFRPHGGWQSITYTIISKIKINKNRKSFSYRSENYFLKIFPKTVEELKNYIRNNEFFFLKTTLVKNCPISNWFIHIQFSNLFFLHSAKTWQIIYLSYQGVLFNYWERSKKKNMTNCKSIYISQ